MKDTIDIYRRNIRMMTGLLNRKQKLIVGAILLILIAIPIGFTIGALIFFGVI